MLWINPGHRAVHTGDGPSGAVQSLTALGRSWLWGRTQHFSLSKSHQSFSFPQNAKGIRDSYFNV